jgi:hypothetical protein
LELPAALAALLITWCPVGIDLTEEVAAIRGEDA